MDFKESEQDWMMKNKPAKDTAIYQAKNGAILKMAFEALNERILGNLHNIIILEK